MTTVMRVVTSPRRQARRPKRFVEEAVKVRHDPLPPSHLIALTLVLKRSLRSVS